jgi:hypothetical protein
LFYGNEKQAIHTPVVPLGFSEFLTRVRTYNQNKAFKGTIRTDQAAAFYNRQTIVQIFYRIPLSQHKAPTVKIDDPEGEFPNRKISLKHVRLSRPEAPFQEMQLDTFFLPNTQAIQRRAGELQREGLMSGESAAHRRVLVSVDVTSRVLDAKMLSSASFGERGLPIRTAQYAAIMLRPHRDTLKKLTTDDGNEFTDLFQSTLQKILDIPDLQFVRVSKQGTSQTHPGVLAPVETAVRSIREHLEKYRRLYNTPHYTHPEGLHSIVSSFNRTKNQAFLHRYSPNEFVAHSLADTKTEHASSYFHRYREAVRGTQAQALASRSLRVGEIVRVRRAQSAFWKQSYQNLTCHLYRVKEIKKSYLVTLRRLKYPTGGYHGAIQNTEEEEAEKFIHITRLIRFHTDYLYDPPPAYTYYQTFVRRLRQAEDEAGAQYVLQPVPVAQRDATKRPNLKELLKQPAVTVQPRVLRPRTQPASSSQDESESTNPYARTYGKRKRN